MWKATEIRCLAFYWLRCERIIVACASIENAANHGRRVCVLLHNSVLDRKPQNSIRVSSRCGGCGPQVFYAKNDNEVDIVNVVQLHTFRLTRATILWWPEAWRSDECPSAATHFHLSCSLVLMSCMSRHDDVNPIILLTGFPRCQKPDASVTGRSAVSNVDLLSTYTFLKILYSVLYEPVV